MQISPTGIWHPVNAGDGEAGTITLAGATAHSVNTVFAQLIAQLGPRPVVDMAHAPGHPLGSAGGLLRHAGVGGRQPAGDDQRVRDDRRSGRAALGDAVPPGEDRGLAGSTTASRRRASRCLLATTPTWSPTRCRASSARAPAPRPRSRDSLWPARPGRRTRTSTRGSAATRCSSSPACGWAGRKGEIPMENIEGVPSVYGGTIPAAIWHDFMTTAMEGQTPESFPVPSFDGYTIGPLGGRVVADAIAERDAKHRRRAPRRRRPIPRRRRPRPRRRPRRHPRPRPRRPRALPDASAPGPPRAPRPAGSAR